MKKLIKRWIKKMLGIKSGSFLEDLKKRGLRVGKNFKMLEGCVIDDSHCWHIEIGDDVTLAPRVLVLAHDASTKMHLNYTRIKNVKIGNKVFIGAGTIILPGIKIGDNVIIGAGSVVTKDIPNNSLFAGNPAKFICSTDSFITRMKSQMSDKNCFGEDYTLRAQISSSMKEEMFEIVASDGVGFVL
jgi:maltose O-acetyltransferase